MDKLLTHLRKCYSSRKPTDVGEIICDGIQIREITKGAKDEMERYVNVNLLCLNDCQLETLNNLPELMLLEEIQLSNNSLDGRDIEKLSTYPHLTIVKLSHNKINAIEDLRPFEKLSEVLYLDLSACSVTKCDNYRKKVFEMIPHLKHLDLLDRDGNNCSEIDVKSIKNEEELIVKQSEDQQKEEIANEDEDEDEVEEEDADADAEEEDDEDFSNEEEKDNTISEEDDINKIVKYKKYKK